MIRRGGQPDVPFLKAMLRHAYHWRVNAGEAEIPASRYVERWGRRGDASMIALDDDGHSVGAAWYRLYAESAPGYGFVDERTPELTIAVVPSKRGGGVGRELLEALLDRARADGYERISLNVRRDSKEQSFYARHGFEPLRDDDGSVTMVATP